jgi:hypothetical protein
MRMFRMMRRAFFFALLVLAIRLSADCSWHYPTSSYSVDFHSPVCNAASPCLQNRSIHFSVAARVGGCYIPFYPGPCPAPYVIDSCDILTWDFGDGTPKQTVYGNGEVSHVFPVAGNFTIYVDIQNAFGTGTIHGSVYVCADPPTYIRFSKPVYEVSEHGGSVTVTLERSGDTSRAFTLDYSTFPNGAEFVRNLEPFMTTVSFAPGETVKNIVHRVQDDDVFTGDSDHSVGVVSDGAALTDSGPVATSTIRVIEDEAGPELSIDDVTVPEGNNEHQVLFTFHLTKPASDRVYAWCVPHDGTARAGIDFRLLGNTTIIEPGQTTATCQVTVLGNSSPEPDKTFTVTTDPILGPVTVKKGTALCTLTNDDVVIPPQPALGFAPSTLRTTSGSIEMATIHASSPMQVTLVSSDRSVVEVGSTGSAPGAVRITAVKPGNATITATGDGLTATLDVEVFPPSRRRPTR